MLSLEVKILDQEIHIEGCILIFLRLFTIVQVLHRNRVCHGLSLAVIGETIQAKYARSF